MTAELDAFITQDTLQILQEIPSWAIKIADIVTDLAAFFKPEEEYESDPTPKVDHLIYSVNLFKSQFDIDEAKAWAVRNKYAISKFTETQDEYRFQQTGADLIKLDIWKSKNVKIGELGYLICLYK